MTIYLCGFMGCGKTTIGNVLAERLNLKYTDMDEYITATERMTIPQIFSEKGEEYFRNLESKAICTLGEKGGVISCGGGAIINENNALTADTYGAVVFLDVPFEVCYERIKYDTNRPIVTNSTEKELENIYDTRYRVYKKHCSFYVDANKTPEEVTDSIIKILNTKYK